MSDADDLARTADRLDELAETAELMGDTNGATRLRQQAGHARMQAIKLNDG